MALLNAQTALSLERCDGWQRFRELAQGKLDQSAGNILDNLPLTDMDAIKMALADYRARKAALFTDFDILRQGAETVIEQHQGELEGEDCLR